MSRGRNRRSRKEDTHNGGSGQPARRPARITDLTIAGKSLHAPVCVGVEDARAGAKPRLTYRDLRRRSRDPVPEGQSRRGLATTARDHGQTEAHGQRGEDTNLQGAGRGVRLPGVYVRADVLSENRKSVPGVPAIEEEHQAHGREYPRADRPIGELARDHRAGGQVEPYVTRMGELLRSRHRLPIASIRSDSEGRL